MKIITIVVGILFFICCLTFFLKRLYILMAINRVRIPLYIEQKELFCNNMPLITMKNQRKVIRFTILIVSIASLFFGYAFYIILTSLLVAFIISRLTFNSRVWEQNFIEDYKEYLK